MNEGMRSNAAHTSYACRKIVQEITLANVVFILPTFTTALRLEISTSRT